MPTLTQIRINKNASKEYNLYNKLNYRNPYPINLISTLIKSQNINLINQICDKNNVCNETKQEIIDHLVKPNYYTPYIVNSQLKEKLQQII